MRHTKKVLIFTNTFIIFFQASPPENFIENFNVVLTQYTASLQCIVPVFMYLVGILFLLNICCEDNVYLGLLSEISSTFFAPKHSLVLERHQYSVSFECFQNKFYIESKLNRDLREDLMKLFADHVAEKHVNTLMRKCIPSFVVLMTVSTFVNCSSVCNCECVAKVGVKTFSIA